MSTRNRLLALLTVILITGAPTAARAQQGEQVLANERLAVTLDPATGGFSVLDKKAGVRWAPFAPKPSSEAPKAKDSIRFKKADSAPTIDGDLSDWKNVPPIALTADMVAHAKTVTDNRDLSALAFVTWDDRFLYVAVRVTDDIAAFRDTTKLGPDVLEWWQKDSVEFWIGEQQFGLVVNPEKSLVILKGKALDDCRIVARQAGNLGRDGNMPGYVVEAAIPMKYFPEFAPRPEVGRRAAFAIGVNDADATGAREGQIYYPRTWAHSRVETFAEAVLADAAGQVSEEQIRKAVPEAPVLLANAARISDGLRFETELDSGRGQRLKVTVQVTLHPESSDVCVEIAGPNEAEIGTAKYPPPLAPEKGESWLAIAPCLLLPLRADKLPRDSKGNPRIGWGNDMSFFGVTDIAAGYGYACILDTPDDGQMALKAESKDPDARMAAGVVWTPCMRKWGYTRKVIYRFCPEGGYVALAKAYRQYAQEKGLLKTLREKMKRRPELAKLMGAPDVWGAKGLEFCREAKAAGIDRMLVNGSWGVKDTEAIKALGYLVSVYDNYEDIMMGKRPPYGDCKTPEDSPLMADGKRMLGWPTHKTDPKTGKTELDPKTGKPVIVEQMYKRCSALDLECAKRFIPKDQEKNPRNARFLDVTTAGGTRECYDPKHYCTRAQDREYKQGLAHYVSDELRLVLGGEHGRWWGVPFYDYWEGMQSGGFYSWPAGYVGMDLPKTREEIGQDYLTYGIGHYYRIPLWELVFGDCVVSYWYWGDSTGHLYDVAPEISYKQDLFDMLYGNPPLYWVSRPFGFNWSKPDLRERLLESYRNTCKLNEQTGLDEMLSHEWLTEDRAVQKSVFSSGTFVVVNFTDKTYDLKDGDKLYTLSPLGFFAKGPTILQYRIRRDGRDVTYIKTPDYLFADAGGGSCDLGAVVSAGPVTVRAEAPHKLKVILSKAEETLIRPGQMLPKWDAPSTHVFSLDGLGERTGELAPGGQGQEGVELGASGTFEIVCGKENDLPNPAIADGDISIAPENPKQGDKVTVTAVVHNTGRVKAKDVAVGFYLDSPDKAIKTQRVSIPGGESQKVTCDLDTANLDGPRKIIVVCDPGRKGDLVKADNAASQGVVLAPDYARWRCKLKAEVVGGKVEQEDAPVVLGIDFGKALGGGMLDLNSIRVCEQGADGAPGAAVPCQFDKAGDFDAKTNPKGEVVWLVGGKLAPGARKAYLIFFDTVENGPKASPAGGIWDAQDTTATTEGYRAVLREGCIVELYDKLGSEREKSFLTGLVYSSKQTGWTSEENSEVLGIDVKANGPLRAVVTIRKKLGGGLEYEKTYTFYPRRFDLDFKSNKSYGSMSRAYYGLEGVYEDESGNKATVDGKGDAEGVSGKVPNPKYYVVYAPGWAHSCVALSKFTGLGYWDSGHMGGISLSGGDIAGAHMSYVLHPGQADAKFGKTDFERLTNPPSVRLCE